MKQVFISYQHEDGDFADILISKVKEAGFITWIDADQLRAGTDWREGIDHAIKDACALIVIMSPAAKASEYVTYEWSFAWGVGIKVIPVVFRHTPLHPRLETLQYLDFTIRTARPWDRLLETVKEAVDMPNPPRITFEQWIQSGDKFFELEMYDKSREAYEEAIQLEPNNAPAYKKKGDALNKLKKYREALISYEKAVQLQPGFIDARLGQFESLNMLKLYREALAICEEVLNLDENNADAYYYKGSTLYDLQLYEEAL